MRGIRKLIHISRLGTFASVTHLGINLKCNPAAATGPEGLWRGGSNRSIISNGVKKDDLNSKIEHYKPQAKVYADAIKTIFGQPPKEVILFFLHLMEPVLVQ